VPLIQAAMRHKGFALIDVLSPCVTFNDHEGSTKSYEYTREHYDAAVHADFVPFQREISAEYAAGDALPIVLHDGSRILLRKLAANYDPTDRVSATAAIADQLKKGEFLTGLLYVDTTGQEFHDVNETPAIPLNQIPHSTLSPGSAALAKVLARYR
jgi:2-oxoglutarate/2-oxoacid ferredoxin oxidoreductase subunit beta